MCFNLIGHEPKKMKLLYISLPGRRTQRESEGGASRLSTGAVGWVKPWRQVEKSMDIAVQVLARLCPQEVRCVVLLNARATLPSKVRCVKAC